MMRIPVIFAALALAGCGGPKTEEEPLSRAEFVEVYLDLMLAAGDDTTAAGISPSASAVLDKHGVSAERFRATVRRYGDDPGKWRPFFADALRRWEERSRDDLEMKERQGTP